jgi:hypothetical protein
VLGVTVDEFYTEAQAYATETVKMEVVFFYIAYAEGLLEDIDWAEYDEYLEFIAEEYRSTPEEFEKTYGEKAVIRSMIWDKVMDYVMSISTPVAE